MACVPIRFWICMILCFIGVISILNRLNLNIAIVSMVENPKNETKHSNVCPALNLKSNFNKSNSFVHDLNPDDVEEEEYTGEQFDWSPELQGIILGSFYWTYFISQTPAGYIVGRYGGLYPICISLLVSGIISIASPFLIPISAYAFIGSRVVLGIFQSCIFSALFVIGCSWVPLHERSTAVALIDIGPHIGNLIVLFSSGFLIKAYTWQIMFWGPGALSLVAFAIVAFFLRNDPETHRLVGETELDHIRGRISKSPDSRRASEGSVRYIDEMEESVRNNVKTRDSIPWLEILMNGPVLAFLFFRFCRAFVTYLIAAELPTYLKVVLREDIVSVGIIISIYTAIHIIAAMTSARLAEFFIQRGILSRTNCRKFFSLLSGSMSAIFLVLIPIAGCNRTLVRIFFAIEAIFTGCGTSSDGPVAAEMSTKFHAIIYALGNMAGNIPGFMAPQITGMAVQHIGDQWTAWKVVFFSIAGLLMFANLIYIVWFSAKRQLFDLTPKERRASRRLSLHKQS